MSETEVPKVVALARNAMTSVQPHLIALAPRSPTIGACSCSLRRWRWWLCLSGAG